MGTVCLFCCFFFCFFQGIAQLILTLDVTQCNIILLTDLNVYISDYKLHLSILCSSGCGSDAQTGLHG